MKPGQRGFTLIEVMVAILLMAIVSLIAWRGLDSVTRTGEHLQASAEQTRSVLVALRQLERDTARLARVELNEPIQPDAEPPLVEGLVAMTVRGAQSKGFELELIRDAAREDGTLQRVRWWLQGNTLYRSAAFARSVYPLPAPKEQVAVLDGISQLEVRVWQPGKGWRRLDGNRLDNPTGIEITLARQTPQGVEHYRQVLGPFQ